MSFTPRQQAQFRDLVKRAWAKHCERMWPGEPAPGLNTIAQRTWYEDVLSSTLGSGIRSTKDADMLRGYAPLMLAFAAIAGDEEAMERYGASDEKRALHWLREIQEKAGADGVEIPDGYVAGIQRRMGYGALSLEELPAEHVRRIAIACNKHWQAKRRQQLAEVPY